MSDKRVNDDDNEFNQKLKASRLTSPEELANAASPEAWAERDKYYAVHEMLRQGRKEVAPVVDPLKAYRNRPAPAGKSEEFTMNVVDDELADAVAAPPPAASRMEINLGDSAPAGDAHANVTEDDGIPTLSAALAAKGGSLRGRPSSLPASLPQSPAEEVDLGASRALSLGDSVPDAASVTLANGKAAAPVLPAAPSPTDDNGAYKSVGTLDDVPMAIPVAETRAENIARRAKEPVKEIMKVARSQWKGKVNPSSGAAPNKILWEERNINGVGDVITLRVPDGSMVLRQQGRHTVATREVMDALVEIVNHRNSPLKTLKGKSRNSDGPSTDIVTQGGYLSVTLHSKELVGYEEMERLSGELQQHLPDNKQTAAGRLKTSPAGAAPKR